MYLGELIRDCEKPGFYPRRKVWPGRQFATFVQQGSEWTARRWEQFRITNTASVTADVTYQLSSPSMVRNLSHLVADDWEILCDTSLTNRVPLGYQQVHELLDIGQYAPTIWAGPPDALPPQRLQIGDIVHVDVDYYRTRSCALKMRDVWQNVHDRRGVVVYADVTATALIYVDEVLLSVFLGTCDMSQPPWPVWQLPPPMPAILDVPVPPVMLGPRSRPIELEAAKQ